VPLSTYAEQLGLATEFDMGRVIGEGKTLNKSKLYGSFLLDVVLYGARNHWVCRWLSYWRYSVVKFTKPGLMLGVPLIGLGVGVVIKALIMFPSYSQAPETDVLTLMSDPYASPLRGRPAKLKVR
jgi:hypothetical protein